MSNSFSAPESNTPAKFYPPPFDPARHLFRETLVVKLLSQRQQNRLVIIEAQAGQGKSTLVAQYVSRLKSPSGWYQLGPEDGDPVRFLTALLTCLTGFIPGFSSPLLADMIRKGEINALEYQRYLDILCADLSKQLARECWLVFDDLHILEESPHGEAFLVHLIEHAPGRLRFVLASRRPIRLGKEPAALHQDAFVLRNEALELSEDETFTLLNDIFQTPVSRGEARELQRSTEGWAMGLVLAGQEMAGDRRKRFHLDATATLKKASVGSLADYFREQVFPRIPANMRQSLCRLSLLATIPLPLADVVSGSHEIASLLSELSEKNSFVRPLNDAGTEFAFHHLFREALRIVAGEDLSQDEQRNVLKTAGDYFFALKSPEDALGYYGEAGDYPAVEKVLARDGMALLAMNRLLTVEAVLNVIASETVKTFGWMSLFMGVIQLNTNPIGALPYLLGAKATFEKEGDDVGKLLALAQHIYFHCFMDCRFTEGVALLKEVEKSFLSSFDRLDVHSKIQTSLSICAGYTYFEGDIGKANLYSTIALRLAEEHSLDNFKASATSMRGMAGCLLSNWDQLKSENDKAYILSGSPRLNHVAKFLLTALPFNYFAISGDAERINLELASMKEKLGKEMVQKSAFEPFCILFEADALLGMGRVKEASELIHKGLGFGFSAANPHLRSQYLHYWAYLSSLNGEAARARSAAEESLSLRAVAGGKVFTALNEMIIGGTYGQIGMAQEAEDFLAKALCHSEELGERFIRAGAYAHRASLRLRLGHRDSALTDLRECLRCMAESGSVHFFSWTPKVMRPLLQAALAHDIYPEYAQKLARDRLGIVIFADNTSIPLLEIMTLGGLSLSFEGYAVDSEDLTRSMRELLAMVISAPGLKISQEEILATLWPDVNAAKARSRLDSLLLELRKTLKAAFTSRDFNCYLALKKGMLCLQNCRVDAQRFAGFAEKGLAHARKKEYWQAGNSFWSAASCWKGAYLPGLRGNDQTSARGEEMERLRHDALLTWGRTLSETGRFYECIEVLNQALQSDRTSDDLVRMLYHAHLRNNQPALANQVLKRYEVALKAAEYAPAEIAHALEAVWDAKNKESY